MRNWSPKVLEDFVKEADDAVGIATSDEDGNEETLTETMDPEVFEKKLSELVLQHAARRKDRRRRACPFREAAERIAMARTHTEQTMERQLVWRLVRAQHRNERAERRRKWLQGEGSSQGGGRRSPNVQDLARKPGHYTEDAWRQEVAEF